MSTLHFKGSNCLRQRLMLSVLTGKPIRVSNIRTKDDEPGIAEYEAKLFKLIEKVTNGTVITIDETGSEFEFKPGLLFGGKIDHDCGLERCISYYLEVLLVFAPFCKKPIEATLKGITNDQIDVCVDLLKNSALPVVKMFLGYVDDNDLEIKVISRGVKPNGGGCVSFKCPIRRVLKPIQMVEQGKVKRIRGVAFATRVSPQMANRMVEVAKGILLEFIPDIYIHTDHLKGKNSGKSPGFGLSLVAETTNGVFYTGEAMSNPLGSEPSVPEDIAKKAAHALLDEIFRGGCIDSTNQGLALLFMALGQTDLSKLMIGPPSPYTIQLLRHMKEFLQVTFKLDSVNSKDSKSEYKIGGQKIIATCIGVGFSNLSKTIS